MNSLYKLSNQELETSLKDLMHKERKLLYVILEHIKEVDRRELYLAKAYPSLFEYLVKETGYSGSSAMRRLQAARLLREIPALAEKIQLGAVNLSQVGELSRAVKEKEKIQQVKISSNQKEELLAKISLQTLPESQRILAAALDLPLKSQDVLKMQKDASVRIEITLSKVQYEQLLKCRDQAFHILQQNQNDTSSWASVIEVLTANFIRKSTTASLTDCESNFSTLPKVPLAGATKFLASNLRNEILSRDKCCQFKDRVTGRQCQSTFALQVDHRQAQWAGGNHARDNLQVFCASHNAYKYRRENSIKRPQHYKMQKPTTSIST